MTVQSPGSLERRRRTLCALLALLAIWPALHHVVARTQETDPWKLFGWAMYAAPPGRVQVRVDGDFRGELRPLVMYGSARDARDRFATRRATLGRLASPEPLARAALDAHPQADAIVVVVRRWTLDRDSAKLVTSDRHHRFERDTVRPGGAR